MQKAVHHRDTEAIKDFGNKVREHRKAKGMTMEELSNNMGIHATQLARIERGEVNVTISYIVLLANALQVPIDELIVLQKTQAK